MALGNCLALLHRNGYLQARIDSIAFTPKGVLAYGHRGYQYRWVNFGVDSATSLLLRELNILAPHLKGRAMRPRGLTRFTQDVLRSCENNGYPFASVTLSKVEIGQKSISAKLRVERGARVLFDTLTVKGDARLNSRYIASLIRINKGAPYSEDLVRQIDTKLQQQPFVAIIRPTEVEFLPGKARVYCYLSNRSASRFNGLVGFYADRNSGKLKLTGDMSLSLVNAFRRGEKLDFVWNTPGEGSQRMNIRIDYPFLFWKQMGLNGNFVLYRRDSSYMNINPQLALAFNTPANSSIELTFSYLQTSTGVKSSGSSLYGSSKSYLYGVGFKKTILNDYHLPSKGYSVHTRLSGGKRVIGKNNSPSVPVFEGQLDAQAYIPLVNNQLVLILGTKSWAKQVLATGTDELYENELFRLGGQGTLRGFNQEAVAVSAYSIQTIEIHLRSTTGTGVFLLADQGLLRAYSAGSFAFSKPTGIGLGINISTKSGILNFCYAMGQGFGQTISIRDAKVHLGYAAEF
jgi:outer membrane protein assembly factor BamA